MSTPSAVERLTIGLIARTAASLRTITEQTGMSKADVVNRAVLLYAYVEQRTDAGDELLIRSATTGEIERVKLF